MNPESVVFLCLAAFFLILGCILRTGRSFGLIVGYKTLFKGWDALPEQKRGPFERFLAKFIGGLFLAIGGGFLLSAAGSLCSSGVLTAAGVCITLAAAGIALIYPWTGRPLGK